MDRIIEIKVNGSYLTKDNDYAGVQHEANAKTLRIEFDEGWDGYVKTVTFWNALHENSVKRILTADLLEDLSDNTRIYLCKIPGEAMTEEGKMSFVIDGYVDGTRQRSIETYLKVSPADIDADAGEPMDPTPSQAEQLQVQIDTILQDVSDEADRTDALEADVDALKADVDALEAADAAQDERLDALEAADAAQDERLDALEQGAAAVGGDVATLQGQVADLLYEAIAITSSSITPSTAENGDISIESVKLEWRFSKKPVSVTLGGIEHTPTIDGTVWAGGRRFTTTTSWKLVGTDERGAKAEETLTLSFLNGVYYGTAAMPETVDSAFVLSLREPVLTPSRKRTITVDAGAGEYIWYAVPVDLGECTFTVGVLQGGFELVDTIQHTNQHGYTAPNGYRIYKSVQAGLGATTVEVS